MENFHAGNYKIKQKVIDNFIDSITDRVFLMIQNGQDLMLEYLRLVSNNTLDTVNKSLGKAVKERQKLENDDRELEPDSSMIKSYMRHRIMEKKI